MEIYEGIRTRRRGKKSKTCQMLYDIAQDSMLPWLCGGEFNLILASHEKQRRVSCNKGEVMMFKEMIEECALMDMGFIGHNFT